MPGANDTPLAVRLLAFAFALAWMAGATPGRAQDHVVQSFTGTGVVTTQPFKAADKWEIQWDAPDFINITLLQPDGTLVGGTAGSLKGSVYYPEGGTFYLQIDGHAAWHVSVVEMGPVAASAPDASAHYSPPSMAKPPPATTNMVAASPVPSSSGATNVVSTAAIPPAPTPAHVPPTTPPLPQGLTEEESRAIVMIKGDVGEGTGFLAHTKDGPAVITNIHVIFANPHIRILTTDGAEIKTLSLKGASDRDLAMFLIQDEHYNYLDLANDIPNTVEEGDATITPGNSEGGEVMLDTKGEVLGIGPDKIEFSNPIYHGNSGGPVFHVKSGKVIAVVSYGKKTRPTDELDKASAADSKSAITGAIRYFGYRLDTVPAWEPYDEDRFLAQTTFLKNFEELNRCLDSFLNGLRYERAGLTSMNPNEGAPNSTYYLRNEKISAYYNTFRQQSADTDNSQRLDAQRELVMDLQGQADLDLPTIRDMSNFYSYEQLRAKHDAAYRKALKTEMDNAGKISDFGR